MSRLVQPKFKRYIEIEGSDLVKSVQYDPDSRILDAHLKNGDRYRYRDLYDADFAKLVTSNSAGKAFNKYIKRDWLGNMRKATKLPRIKP